MLTAREAALIAWSAFLCVSASFLRSACVRPPPPPSAQKMQYRSVGDLALAQKTCWREMHGRYTCARGHGSNGWGELDQTEMETEAEIGTDPDSDLGLPSC